MVICRNKPVCRNKSANTRFQNLDSNITLSVFILMMIQLFLEEWNHQKEKAELFCLVSSRLLANFLPERNA